MTETEPKVAHGTIYILHGDDALAIHRAVKELIAGDGQDSEKAQSEHINVTWLDGNSATVDQMYTAAYTLPFFTGKTRVVITDPIARIQSQEKQDKFIRLLDKLPDTTLLILVVEDEPEGYGKNTVWRKLGNSSWLMKWINKGQPGCGYRNYKLPEQGAMPNHIIKEAENQGGKISMPAARELAERTGNDTYMASQEIAKLLMYVNSSHQIEIEDVRQISVSGSTARLFDMVDAVANGNTREAIHLLHVLLEEEDIEFLFGMVIRQFRLLIQTRAIMDELKSPQMVAQKLGVISFVADKLLAQARRFDSRQLSKIYHDLLEIDWESKVSAKDLDVALDELIVRLGK